MEHYFIFLLLFIWGGVMGFVCMSKGLLFVVPIKKWLLNDRENLWIEGITVLTVLLFLINVFFMVLAIPSVYYEFFSSDVLADELQRNLFGCSFVGSFMGAVFWGVLYRK